MSEKIRIPKTRMTKEQSKHAMKILDSGNILLRKWSVYDKKKCARLFRNAIFEGQTNPRNVIPENLMPEFDCDRVVILAAKRTTFEDGRTVEEAVLQNYAGIAERLAYKYVLRNNNTFEFSDFVQEGYMQIIECMYSWLAKFEVEMSTFVYCSIKRRYAKLINTGNLFCPLTNSDIDLILQYQSIKEKSNSCTFDEIVSKMELDYEQSIGMSRLFCKIINHSQIENKSNRHHREDGFGNDYTHLSVESHNDVNTTEQNEYVKNIISKANLTPLEDELIHIAMESHKAGWQSEFAKTHVSPKTGKPYSRMRITQILESAREKIRKAM